MSDTDLIEKIRDKSAVITVIGLGYVGLPLALRFVEAGFKVIGVDTDHKKIASINDGRSYIGHISSDRIRSALTCGLSAADDFSVISGADAIIICVPTPLSARREPDLGYIREAMDQMMPYLRFNQILSLESTTYPGTTEEEILPKISGKGFEVGSDFYLVYSPEREDPGNTEFSTKTIPKVCGGVTAACLEVGVALYSAAIDTIIPVGSARVAEMSKLMENIYRAVNIGLANEMKKVASAMGVDIFEVIRAAATKPFGFHPFYPGPGVGGHCIPVDPLYLAWKAREIGVRTDLIGIADEVNRAQPRRVVDSIVSALNVRRKSVNGASILLLGVAYKKNIDDTRESPAHEIIGLLTNMRAIVEYSDPHVPLLTGILGHYSGKMSVPLFPYVVREYDCVVLVTAHDCFDYLMIEKESALIIDTRGIFSSGAAKIIRA